MQVFCLIAMEKPVSYKPEHIRDEKVKVSNSTSWLGPAPKTTICSSMRRSGKKFNQYLIKTQKDKERKIEIKQT